MSNIKKKKNERLLHTLQHCSLVTSAVFHCMTRTLSIKRISQLLVLSHRPLAYSLCFDLFAPPVKLLVNSLELDIKLCSKYFDINRNKMRFCVILISDKSSAEPRQFARVPVFSGRSQSPGQVPGEHGQH